MITISNLTSKKSGKDYTYADLNLEFEEKKVSSNSRNNNIASGNDLVISTEVEAIKNSIRNILFQRRHLNPQLNVNLKKHLGQSISEMRALSIGEDIERAVNLYEPRVKLEKVVIRMNQDQGSYFIELRLTLVNFNQAPIILQAQLTNVGDFSFINN